MVEVGDGAGFGQIGFGGFGTIHQLAMRHLDGDETLQLVVVGEVDEAEAAFAQDFLDPVATDLLRTCFGCTFILLDGVPFVVLRYIVGIRVAHVGSRLLQNAGHGRHSFEVRRILSEPSAEIIKKPLFGP